jgi:topoisomerase IA-like protein
MPFVNKAQEAVCRIKAAIDISNGFQPRWSCDEFKEGDESAKNQGWIPLTKKELIVYEGKKGGLFRIFRGKKYYAKEFHDPTIRTTAKKTTAKKTTAKKTKTRKPTAKKTTAKKLNTKTKKKQTRKKLTTKKRK